MSNVPKLRFKEFIGEWEEKNLKELSTLITKGTTPKKFLGSEINFVKIEGISNLRINVKKCLYISSEIHDNELKRSKLQENDILFAIAGSLGKVAIVTKDILPANTNQALSIIRLKDKSYLKYIIFILQSKLMKKYIYKNLSIGAQPNLSLEQVGNFKFQLPQKQEQEKIASFLTSVDTKIEQLTKKESLLQEYKKGVMQKIFNQEIRFKDDDRSEFCEWELEELAKYLIKHDEKTTTNNQYPVLTSSRKGLFFQKDYFDGNDVASKDTTGYNVVPRGYFTYRHMSDDLIFKVNINNIVDKGIVSTLYPVFTTKNINNYFLQIKLNEGNEFKRYVLIQKQGGSRTYMYFKKLQELKVNLPCIKEQTKIVNFLSSIDKKIENAKDEVEKTKQFKKALLQQMFV